MLYFEMFYERLSSTPRTPQEWRLLVSFPGKTLQIIKGMKGDSGVLCLANIPGMTSGKAASLHMAKDKAALFSDDT